VNLSVITGENDFIFANAPVQISLLRLPEPALTFLEVGSDVLVDGLDGILVFDVDFAIIFAVPELKDIIFGVALASASCSHSINNNRSHNN
jgi:hypothetical protein